MCVDKTVSIVTTPIWFQVLTVLTPIQVGTAQSSYMNESSGFL